MNCTSDDECRTRSAGKSNLGSRSGLSSACDVNSPEDCSRCVYKDAHAVTGTCECTGGGPRCSLCRQAGGGIDPDTGKDWKGYYRLNDECQECPDHPELLLALMVTALVLFCIVGWWMQDKRVNVAFMSIGVDYFQVLAIFARIKVRWPLWVKQILQVLSIFNFVSAGRSSDASFFLLSLFHANSDIFPPPPPPAHTTRTHQNIDIAAPECFIPNFDYRVKWTLMMVLPLIFAGFLLSIFLAVCIFKCIRYYGHCSGKRPKYFSHANKLVSMFVIIFYFVYLTVTRRALDIFNCNPPDPPDGYMYTEFTSIDCAGGTCVCDDPNSLQAQLKPYAVLSFIVYSLGFPLFVGWMTWFYRIQIKLDQLLRAHDLGETRQEAIENMRFTPRRCRSKTRHTYDLRKNSTNCTTTLSRGKCTGCWLS